MKDAFWRGLEAEDFRRWIEGQGEFVGRAGDSAWCPIGRWIEDVFADYEGEWWSVGNLPRWAVRFVTRIDNLPENGHEYDVVRRDTALRVLEEVTGT